MKGTTESSSTANQHAENMPTEPSPAKMGPEDIPSEVTSGEISEEDDRNIVTWDGPDDPQNPMNWPDSRKWINLALMSLLTIISPLGSSMFAPGIPRILAEFKTNDSLIATFITSIYFLGFAFGPLVVAPLSELYGRVYIYHISNVLFVSFCVGAALSTSIDMLMAFRFLMGVVGSVPTTIGVGSIVDVMPIEKRGRSISLWAIGPLLGPSIGPVAGGYLIQAAGWRWVYWLLAIMGGVCSILALLIMRETYAPVLLECKARRLRKETGNHALRTKADRDGKKLIQRAVIRPFKFLFMTPLVSIIAAYVGIAYGILYLLIATFSFVYTDQYHFSEGDAGLAFLPAGLGMMIGVLTFGNVQDYLVKKAKEGMKPDEKYRPEVKITPWLTSPTGLTIPIGLFIYGWTTEYKVHWIVPMIGVVILSGGLTGVTMCVQNYQIDSYERYAASGSAAVTLSRSLIGALMPLGGLKMYDALGLGWGNSLLGFMSLALVPVPVGLFFYGGIIRRRFDPAL
ncbi:polyamine transporter 3 [Colletotrichum nymphaeae SA-01]|uniref:Polyamine transporter 3 n=1 Tax=Colletotrichum nymphaeae SA-01 TaxID=1460502 RepID=A0A135UJW5_9PEZI|nr:polyamine transporter 3 [Colletotrichum nymphaeae SA-01]